MDKEKIIKEELDGLLKRLDVEFESSVVKEGENYLVQVNTGEDAPLLIGRHGDVLNSFKKIIEAILFKKFGESVNISLNINDYQEKQKERLSAIAQTAITRAKEEGKATLRSFSSYERRIIHEYISENFKDFKSYSEGEGADRVLVIEQK